MTLTTPRLDLRASSGCNRLLAALSDADFALLEPHLMSVSLTSGQVLFEPGDDVTHSHFPCEGAVTAIVIMNEDGRQVEAATIGREGVIGGIVSQGHKPAFGRGVVHISGRALRLSSDRLEAAKQQSPKIADLFTRYADYLLAQVMQLSNCNALHSLEQRLCRVLVMAQDRTGEEVLDFTQQGLADSLGVQRTSVTSTVKALEDRDLIKGQRGRIQILNRRGLEAMACGCYDAIEEHFRRLLPKVEA